MEAAKQQLLNLHIELETSMSEIYSLYANEYKAYEDFWRSLVKEEMQHVNWLNKLITGINANKLIFDEDKARIASLTTLILYLKNTKKEFLAKPFPIIRAASIVRDFENSLLEKKIFTCFAGDSPQVKEIVAKLDSLQIDHTHKINDMVSKILKEAQS